MTWYHLISSPKVDISLLFIDTEIFAAYAGSCLFQTEFEFKLEMFNQSEFSRNPDYYPQPTPRESSGFGVVV